MCLSIALLFLAYVIGEVASIAILGSHVGALPTIGVILAAAAVGALLLAGRAALTLRAAGEVVLRGEELGPVIASGAMVGAAGVLLFVPGLLSDAIALVLLIPPVRARAARGLVRRVHARVVTFHGGGRPGGPADDGVIDTTGVERPAEREDPGDRGRYLP